MPAQQRDFTATEIKAGILVVVALAVLVGFVAAMRGCGAGAGEVNRFSATFTSINGLNLGAEVRFGGVKVGKVVGIAPDLEDRSRIMVVFEVSDDVPVNHGSVATIDQVSLTTGMHLEISTGAADQPLHRSGDQIASMTTPGGFVDIPDIEGVVTRLESMLDGIIALLGVDRARAEAALTGEEMVDLAAVAAALERTLEAGTATVESVGSTVAENRDGLREIVDRLSLLGAAAEELVANLNDAVAENRAPLHASATNLEQLTADAARQLDELMQSLATTLAYLQEVSGNASELVDDQRPTLEQILLNLEATTRNLRQFSRSLAEQPSALVRGAKPQGRSKGEGP